MEVIGLELPCRDIGEVDDVDGIGCISSVKNECEGHGGVF